MKSQTTEYSFNKNFMFIEQNPELNVELQAEYDYDQYFEDNYQQGHDFMKIRPFQNQPDAFTYRESTSRQEQNQIIPCETKLESLLYNNTECLDSRPGMEDTFIKNTKSMKCQQTHESDSPQLDKVRFSLPIKEINKKQANMGQALMIFFHLKKFYSKIAQTNQLFKGLRDSHLDIIGDQSSDLQILQKYIKLSRLNQFKLSGYNKLVNLKSQTTLVNTTFIDLIKSKLKTVYINLMICLKKLDDRIPVIQSESSGKIYWDYLLTITRIIFLILIPIEITFNTQILFHEQTNAMTVILVILLVIDTLLRLNTVCYVKGQAIEDRYNIMKFQVKSSFIIDTISILPLMYFLSYPSENSIILITLLFFSLQTNYILKIIRQTEESSNLNNQQQGIISLVWFISTLLYILHIFSCIWFYNSIGDAKLHKPTWITSRNLLDSSWTLQYTEAFYFATVTLMTIGYGDITPQNTSERILAVFFILNACVWMSYGINQVGSIINAITKNSTEVKIKMRVINKYLKDRNIPFTLQYKIRQYLNFHWKNENEDEMTQEDAILNQLPEELKKELEQKTNNVILDTCPLFQKYFSTQFKSKLIPMVKRLIIKPENKFDITMNKQENHLCYLEQGTLNPQIHNQSSKSAQVRSIIQPGSFLCINDFVTDALNVQSFRSNGYASMLIIPKSEFLQILTNFPQDYQQYCYIKDQMIFSQLILSNTMNCPACQSSNHTFKQCPFINFIPEREIVIKRYQFNQKQNRCIFKRSEKRKKGQYNSLVEKDLINDFANFFQNDYKQQCKTQNHFTICKDTEEQNEQKMNNQNSLSDNSINLHKPQQSYDQMSIIEENLLDESDYDQLFQSNIPIIKSLSMDNEAQFGTPIRQINQNELTIQLLSKNKSKKIASRLANFNKSQKIIIPQNNILSSNNINIKFQHDTDLWESIMNNNILIIHKRLQDLDSLLFLREREYVEILYLRQRNTKFCQFDDFDSQRNFEQYKIEQNLSQFIPYKEQVTFLSITERDKQIFKQMSAYMLYPSLYIKKYRKKQRSSVCVRASLTPAFIEKLMRMRQLKNSLKKKQTSTEKKTKTNQVIHQRDRQQQMIQGSQEFIKNE